MIDYRVSSYCHLGNCVAVGATPEGTVAVADTKTDQPPLLFTRAEWAAFCDAVRRGELDHVVREAADRASIVTPAAVTPAGR